MAYKCVSCSQVYEDGANEVLTGCGSCGSKFFFYIKAEKLAEIQKNNENINLDKEESKQIERDIRQIAGIEDEEAPVYLDFESVKVVKPGKYLLDLAKLFDKEKPRIYQIEDGKYVIDLVSRNKDKKEVEKE